MRRQGGARLTAAREDLVAGGAECPRGPFDCLLRSVRGEGWSVLYKGHVATMTREIPGTACWFGAYEAFLDAMTPAGQAREDVAPTVTVAAGALGGMAYWGIFYPGDTVKSTVQTAKAGVDASLLGTVRRIYATQGVGGFYRGFGITMLRAAPITNVLGSSQEGGRRCFMLATDTDAAA